MTPTPEQLRARADQEEREELVYAAPDLAKMLRAGADAIEERDRLRAALDIAESHAKTVNGVWQANLRLIAERDALAAMVPKPPTPPAEVYEWNARYDSAWPSEAKP